MFQQRNNLPLANLLAFCTKLKYIIPLDTIHIYSHVMLIALWKTLKQLLIFISNVCLIDAIKQGARLAVFLVSGLLRRMHAGTQRASASSEAMCERAHVLMQIRVCIRSCISVHVSRTWLNKRLCSEFKFKTSLFTLKACCCLSVNQD